MIFPSALDKHFRNVLYVVVHIMSISVFLACIITLYFAYTSKYNNRVDTGIDFNAYLIGAHVVRRSPNLLYDNKTQQYFQKTITEIDSSDILSFRNTPLVGLLYYPYTFFSPKDGYRMNQIVQTLLVLILIFYLKGLIKAGNYFLPMCLLFFPSIYQAMYGQIAILIAFLFVFIYVAMKKGGYFLAGILSSFLIMKFQYVIAIPYLLIFAKDKKKYLSGVALASVLLLIIDSLIYRSFYLPNYIRFLISSENYNMGTNLEALYNLTAFARFFKLPDQLGFGVSMMLYVYTLLIVFLIRNKVTLERIIVSIITWILALTLHTACVDLIFLLLPISLLISMGGKFNKVIAGILFCVPLFSNVYLHGIGGFVLFAVSIINLIPVVFENRIVKSDR